MHVIGRRADGYHLLDSLVVFPPIGDVVRAAPDSALSLSIDGPFAGSLTAEDNLVLRAARALAVMRDDRTAGAAGGSHPDAVGEDVDARDKPGHDGYGRDKPGHDGGGRDKPGHERCARDGGGAGASLRLTKNLPVASGIGGGSADAAAALRVLCRIWGISPDAPEFADLALSLGADVPVCLRSQPARMGGIGEQLAPSPALPECGIALVNPGVPVTTSEVFRARRGGFSAPATLPGGWPYAAAMAADLGRMRNDLEEPAMALCPPIASVLSTLRAQTGCLLARMSGSGATCFGLFDDPDEAERAAAEVRRPGWWSWGGAAREYGTADPSDTI